MVLFSVSLLKGSWFELTLASVIKLLWDTGQSCVRAPRGHGSLQRSQVRSGWWGTASHVMHVNTEDALFWMYQPWMQVLIWIQQHSHCFSFFLAVSDIRSLAPYKHVCSLIVHDLMKSVSFIQQWCLLNCKLTMHSTAVSEWRTSWCKRSNALRCVP